MEDRSAQEPTETDQKADEILDGYKRSHRKLTGWKLALVITSILVVGIMTLMVIFALTLFKNPVFQEAMEQYRVMVQCEENLTQIGAALIRYSSGSGEFPEKLDDLVPEYLETNTVFRCPADKRKDTVGDSYSYKRPRGNAPGDTIVCSCPRHRLLQSQPPLVVELLKDGKVKHTPVAENSKGRN